MMFAEIKLGKPDAPQQFAANDSDEARKLSERSASAAQRISKRRGCRLRKLVAYPFSDERPSAQMVVRRSYLGQELRPKPRKGALLPLCTEPESAVTKTVPPSRASSWMRV